MFPFSDQPPLVVIFEDFEGFLPAVIQNFVMICRYKLLLVIKSCLFYLPLLSEKIVIFKSETKIELVKLTNINFTSEEILY